MSPSSNLRWGNDWPAGRVPSGGQFGGVKGRGRSRTFDARSGEGDAEAEHAENQNDDRGQEPAGLIDAVVHCLSPGDELRIVALIRPRPDRSRGRHNALAA